MKFTWEQLDQIIHNEVCGETLISEDGLEKIAELLNAHLKEWFADPKACGPFLAIVEEQIRADERVKMLKGAVEVFKCAGMGHYDKWIENYPELDTVPSHSAQLINVREIK